MQKLLLSCILLAAYLTHGQTALFNGQNLEGFYSWLVDSGTNDSRRVFSVTNGLLRISGDGLGYLSTTASYSNYVLTLEYKWGVTNTHWAGRFGKARDSGLFLHSFGPDGNSVDGNGAFKAAVECQIMEGATGDFLLIRGRGPKGESLNPGITTRVAPGRDPDGWFYYDPKGVHTKVERWGRINRIGKNPKWHDEFGFQDPLETGEWKTLEIDSRNNSLKIKLNGKLVNAVESVFPAFGPILLQCEGSEIFFRKIRLQSY